jgi:hypothetical protein
MSYSSRQPQQQPLAQTIPYPFQTVFQLSAECEASDSDLQLAINDAEQLLHNVRAKNATLIAAPSRALFRGGFTQLTVSCVGRCGKS